MAKASSGEAGTNYVEVRSVDPDEVVETWMSEAGLENSVLPRRELADLARMWEEEGPLVTENYFSESELDRGYLDGLLEQDALIRITQLDPEKQVKSDIMKFENQLRRRGYLESESILPTEYAKSMLDDSESELYMINPRLRTLFEDRVIKTEKWKY